MTLSQGWKKKCYIWWKTEVSPCTRTGDYAPQTQTWLRSDTYRQTRIELASKWDKSQLIHWPQTKKLRKVKHTNKLQTYRDRDNKKETRRDDSATTKFRKDCNWERWLIENTVSSRDFKNLFEGPVAQTPTRLRLGPLAFIGVAYLIRHPDPICQGIVDRLAGSLAIT